MHVFVTSNTFPIRIKTLWYVEMWWCWQSCKGQAPDFIHTHHRLAAACLLPAWCWQQAVGLLAAGCCWLLLAAAG